MRSVPEHRAQIAALLPRTASAPVPLAAALGRVLAANVVAPVNLPPFTNSAMDGYAVRRADLAGRAAVTPAMTGPGAGAVPSVTLPVSRDIPAGSPDMTPLAAGTAARIMTGAPVPDGADLVVPVELTDGGTETVTITGDVGERPHIRPAGDDVRAGTTVLHAGERVTAARVGAASALGFAELEVYAPVTALVLSTGSELAEPGTDLAPGQIYESNGGMLAAAVTAAGGVARRAHFVSDDVAEFRAAIAEHRSGVDLLLTSGGVSAGAYEVVKDALTGSGVEFVKVAMQPGMPQGCGRFDGLPVVTLPGNPVSAFISFEVFVRPALRAAMGMSDADRPRLTLPVTEALTSPTDKQQFRRGLVDAVAGTVTPVGGPGSHLLGALAAADCLIMIPAGIAEVAAGDDVEVWLLDD